MFVVFLLPTFYFKFLDFNGNFKKDQWILYIITVVCPFLNVYRDQTVTVPWQSRYRRLTVALPKRDNFLALLLLGRFKTPSNGTVTPCSRFGHGLVTVNIQKRINKFINFYYLYNFVPENPAFCTCL